MKYTVLKSLLLGVLVALLLLGCSNPSIQLQEVLTDYSNMLEKELPEDLHLTIYYIDPGILTQYAVSTDRLVAFPGVTKITVESDELASHLELLKTLEFTALQPVQGDSYINARLYYAFEVGDSEKILEVVISEIHGVVFLNGVAVENNPVFYELIIPFLSEEDREILGI